MIKFKATMMIVDNRSGMVIAKKGQVLDEDSLAMTISLYLWDGKLFDSSGKERSFREALEDFVLHTEAAYVICLCDRCRYIRENG